jgi:membrane-associated protein
MPYNKFITYTLIGGVFWTGGVTSAGFYLGKAIPSAHLYLTPIVMAIIVVSILPTIIEYFYSRNKLSRQQNTK